MCSILCSCTLDFDLFLFSIQAIPGLFYSLGQTVTFLEVYIYDIYMYTCFHVELTLCVLWTILLAMLLQADGKESEAGQTSLDWFERGASHGCAFSALQVWRRTQKPHVCHIFSVCCLCA